MMEGTILPELAARGTAVVRSRVLRCAGIGESALAERVDDLFTGSVNPTIAFLASSGEVKVRIAAKAATAEEAGADRARGRGGAGGSVTRSSRRRTSRSRRPSSGCCRRRGRRSRAPSR